MNKFTQNTKRLLVFICSLIVVFSACRNDKNDDSPSRTGLLTSSKWKMTSNTVSPERPVYDNDGNIIGTSGDYFAQMEACFKDDNTKFNTDLTVTFDEGATKCNDNDPQITTGSWVFKNNETILSVTENGNTQDVNILELTENILKLQFSESYMSEDYTYTVTFTH